jgi:membrane fusion protein (multidrug efflux system)
MSIRPSTLLPAAVPAVAPSPPPASVTPPDARSAPAGGTLRRLAIPLLVLVLVAGLSAAAIVNWDRWTSTAAVQATDNAYVRAETTRLSTRVAGAVRRVAAADFQQVRQGDLLVEIDPADYEVQVAQAQASVAGAQAALDNLANQTALQRAAIHQAEAQQDSAQAHESQARLERQRQEELVRTSFGTRQRSEQAISDHVRAQSDVTAAAAAVEAQRRQLDVLGGTRQQRAAELQAAQAAQAAAQLRLGYTRIVAPFDGVVGERQVQPGDYVNIGTNVISVVPLPQVYLIANYKETQLGRVRPGQRVEVTVDTFPGQVLHGRVQRLAPASGSQFALLPADNATGNFTKVVQRIPVRIVFDAGQPLLEQLRPGMSAITRIHTTENGSAP